MLSGGRIRRQVVAGKRTSGVCRRTTMTNCRLAKKEMASHRSNRSVTAEGRMGCTGADLSGGHSPHIETPLASVIVSKIIDSRQTHRREQQDSTGNHLSAVATSTSTAARSVRSTKTIISSLSATKYRRPAVMLALLLLLLLSSPSTTQTATATAALINELHQQKAQASSTPPAEIPKFIHSSSIINSEQLHATASAQSPLSIERAGRLPPPTVDAAEKSFFAVAPLAGGWWQDDVIRRFGRAAPVVSNQATVQVPNEPTCRQLTGAWRLLRLQYPNLVDHLTAALLSKHPRFYLSQMNIDTTLAGVDELLSHPQSTQRMKLIKSPLVEKLLLNPYYLNQISRVINHNRPVILPEYLNNVARSDYLSEADKELGYGRLVKHPNDWTNNHISNIQEKLQFLHRKNLESERQGEQLQPQQQQPSQLEFQQEELSTIMPIYGRLVSNPSESSADSLLNRRIVTNQNLRKLEARNIGYE